MRKSPAGREGGREGGRGGAAILTEFNIFPFFSRLFHHFLFSFWEFYFSPFLGRRFFVIFSLFFSFLLLSWNCVLFLEWLLAPPLASPRFGAISVPFWIPLAVFTTPFSRSFFALASRPNCLRIGFKWNLMTLDLGPSVFLFKICKWVSWKYSNFPESS